ncbi:hypothetical protein B484DRAFT_436567, partial [Ochromonadaceae sp. CCMP2298]
QSQTSSPRTVASERLAVLDEHIASAQRMVAIAKTDSTDTGRAIQLYEEAIEQLEIASNLATEIVRSTHDLQEDAISTAAADEVVPSPRDARFASLAVKKLQAAVKKEVTAALKKIKKLLALWQRDLQSLRDLNMPPANPLDDSSA